MSSVSLASLYLNLGVRLVHIRNCEHKEEARFKIYHILFLFPFANMCGLGKEEIKSVLFSFINI